MNKGIWKIGLKQTDSIYEPKRLHNSSFSERLSKIHSVKTNMTIYKSDEDKDVSIDRVKKANSSNKGNNQKVSKMDYDQVNKKFITPEQYQHYNQKSKYFIQTKPLAQSYSLQQFKSPKIKLQQSLKLLKNICYELKMYMDQSYKYFKELMDTLNLKMLYMRHYYEIRVNNYVKQLNNSKNQIQELKKKVLLLSETNLKDFKFSLDQINIEYPSSNLTNKVIKQEVLQCQSSEYLPVITEIEELKMALNNMRNILVDKLPDF